MSSSVMHTVVLLTACFLPFFELSVGFGRTSITLITSNEEDKDSFDCFDRLEESKDSFDCLD